MSEEASEEKRCKPKFSIGDRVVWHMENLQPHGVVSDGPIWNAAIKGRPGVFYGWAYIVRLDDTMPKLLGEDALEWEYKGLHYCPHCGYKLEE